jgi:hypothetical protein
MRAMTRIRRTVLLALVLFLLATATPGVAGSRRARPADGQLPDGGTATVPYVGTCSDGHGGKIPCPQPR